MRRRGDDTRGRGDETRREDEGSVQGEGLSSVKQKLSYRSNWVRENGPAG